MKTLQLGKNGPNLSVIGFGAWAIGGPWIYGWGKVDDQESIKAIHKALDCGVNWIDTAAAYGLGHSEEVVGKAIKGIRSEVFIATKCGLVPDGKGDVYRNSEPESIRHEIEDSLRRLNVHEIDLYQIHWPDSSIDYENSWATMLRLKEEGKARFIGVCNYEVAMLQRCEAAAPVQSLQPPYSMLTRDVEREILPYCQKQGIGVVAYSPMQSGLLTGRFDIKRLDPDDWRLKASMFLPDQSPTIRWLAIRSPYSAQKRLRHPEMALLQEASLLWRVGRCLPCVPVGDCRLFLSEAQDGWDCYSRKQT